MRGFAATGVSQRSLDPHNVYTTFTRVATKQINDRGVSTPSHRFTLLGTHMYACTVRKDDQTRRFTIRDAAASGWEVREEEDDQVLKRVVYSDWHRVERARMAFTAEASQDGWIDADVNR